MNSSEESSTPVNDKDIELSHLDFPVVGIGASAGGLPALIRFFENMPAGNGMSFVVVLHLSPRHNSSADQILQRATRMPVVKVTGDLPIEKEHVYIIAPNSQLRMNDGQLFIAHFERPAGRHVAIDIFFRALGNVHRERAVAIILSGTGTDGAVGIATVKEQGGVTFAQLPADAEHEGMPRAAIATGIIDFVLPVIDMPQKLVDLWHNARRMELPPLRNGEALPVRTPPPESIEAAEEALQRIISLLRAHSGHDFRHYKRATVLRRIERRMQVRSISNLPDYAALLEEDPAEYPDLLDDMLIGVTNFFRDREAFDTLERELLPQLFQNRPPEEEIRAWVAACSTGEEAYSIAMLLNDQAAQHDKPPPFQVFASDIDRKAINIARKGVYPSSIVTDVPPTRLRQFFTKKDEQYQIRKDLRDRVLFAEHNILRDPPFSKIDLISCRNLLIYLNRNVQAQILEMFHFSLKPGGILFLGSSESAEAVTDFFVPVDEKNRLYRSRAIQRAARFMPPVSTRVIPQPLSSKAVTQRPFSYSEIHQRSLMIYGPVSILVDMDMNIVHMSDRASNYLRFNSGEPSRNLLALILPDLRIELRTALYQAQQTGVSTEKRIVSIQRDKQPYSVTMNVHRFRDETFGSDLLIVQLDEMPRGLGDMPRNLANHKDTVLQQLEDELQRNKEQLQETIESSDISTEELRATNEELQAINEELRSATEELETSKEELQSVNEELITVNCELKMKVEETSKANDDLKNLIASTDIATIFVDSSLRIKRFTPRATELFSIIPSDVGRSLLDLTHVLHYDNLADDITATFESLQPVEREVRRQDGNYYIARLLPYRTTEDKIDGAVVTFFDITRRRVAEERARVGEERMRLVAESTKDYAIITLDTEGNITSWNNGAQRIFGWAEAEVMGQPGAIIFLPEDRARGMHEDEMRRAREDGRAEDERWHVGRDGKRIFCSGVMTPMNSGEFYGYAKIARDQTKRMQEESQRAAALSQEQIGRWNAETSSALKDEFLAIMSHELRHPLNMIHINVELLSRMPAIQDSPVSKKATTVIRNSVLSQAKIIEDLLDMSRLNTGKLTLSTGIVDVASLINSIIDVAREDPAALDLTITTEGTDQPLLIEADSVRLEQIVLNLFSNALKFTPHGGNVTLRLSRENDEARLDVIDNGQGIAPEVLPYIFDMFGQAGSVTNRSKKGLGIGLALVQQIAELHKGRVKASSEGPGKGACFSVWLPLAKEADETAEYGRNILENSVAGLQILIVDDAEEMVFAFKSLLEMDGATVFVATQASEGLEILKREKIDLLISDISMPDINGYEFVELIRKPPLNLTIPAIAVSGLGREQDRAQSLKSGFSAHISKPISMDKLIGTIGELSADSRRKEKKGSKKGQRASADNMK